MKDLRNFFEDFYNKSKIEYTLYKNGEVIQTCGENLKEYENTCVKFSYAKDNYVCILKGDGEEIKYYAKFLLMELNVKNVDVIDKIDLINKSVLGYNIVYELYEKYNLTQKNCVAIVIRSESNSKLVSDFVYEYTQRKFEVTPLNKDVCVLIVSDKLEDYLSLSKFALILRDALREELGINAIIGTGEYVSEFKDISASYKSAQSAISLCTLTGHSGVYSHLMALPAKTLLGLPEKEVELLLKQIAPIYKNKELFESAKVFLNCNLNTTLASKELYVHRNTLSYRLNKIEKLCGLDIRNFDNAVTFRMLMILYILKDKYEKK